MLFRRRETESCWERLRVHLWPRRSWSRSSRYVVYRLRRLSATPHAIALGFAIGAFAAVTPYIGTHMVMAALLAWIIGGSIVAALLGTFVGNPLTYPLIWYATYEVGNVMLRGERRRQRAHRLLGRRLSVFARSAVADPEADVARLRAGGTCRCRACYFLVRPMVEAYQHRRRRELAPAASGREPVSADEHEEPRHDRAASDPPRHQHRSRGNAAQCAGRAPSRSVAGGRGRDRGRRRQHHRASARGPAPHQG